MSSSVSPASSSLSPADSLGLRSAIEQACKSLSEGGIPIGSSLVHHTTTLSEDGEDKSEFEVVAVGHNQRIQKGSAILHGEMSMLENAGRLKADVYRRSTLYTTLSPCDMCTGAILLYRIPRVVIGENINFFGGEDYLRSRGVEVVVVDNEECKAMMSQYIKDHPKDWNEDIGEEAS